MPSNVAGMVAYLLGFVTGILTLVMEPYKNDKFVRFHAFQSIFLSGGYLLVSVAWSSVSGGLLAVNADAFWPLISLGWWAVHFAFFVLWLLLLYKAYNNERFELPLLGPIARKQAG